MEKVSAALHLQVLQIQENKIRWSMFGANDWNLCRVYTG